MVNTGSRSSPFDEDNVINLPGRNSPTYHTITADMTGSGSIDIIFRHSDGLEVLLNTGEKDDSNPFFKNIFIPLMNSNYDGYLRSMEVADVTGSGTLDLIVGDLAGSTVLLLNNGDKNDPFKDVDPYQLLGTWSVP